MITNKERDVKIQDKSLKLKNRTIIQDFIILILLGFVALAVSRIIHLTITPEMQKYVKFLLTVVLPYVALIIAFIALMYRKNKMNTSKSESNLLLPITNLKKVLKMNKIDLFAIVLWQLGITAILSGHFMAFILTDFYKGFKTSNALIHLSTDIGRVFAFIAVLSGLSIIIIRRMVDSTLREKTTIADWVLLTLLFVQINLGMFMFISAYSSPFWFTNEITPWLHGLIAFSPTVLVVSNWFILLHLLNPFVIIMILPFTNIMELFTFPFYYAKEIIDLTKKAKTNARTVNSKSTI